MKTLILAAIRCSLMFTAVTASLFSVRPAQAYTVTLQQVGSNVVANGSGAINLTGLTFFAHWYRRSQRDPSKCRGYNRRGHRVVWVVDRVHWIHRTDEFRERGLFLRQHWQRRLCRH